MFITFEGGEGTGKSTLITKIKKYLESKGYDVILTREPGGKGSKLAEEIRSLVLDPKYKVNPYTEALLYAASRAQHLDEVIIPALQKQQIVLCDRYIDSSFAYQAYARGLGMDFIMDINKYAQDHLPDITFYIDVAPDVGISRIQGREKNDRWDQENLPRPSLEMFPNRIIKIDGFKSLDQIEEEIMQVISDKLWMKR